MGTLTATHLVTAEEYALLPDREDFLHDELIEGEVILSPHVKHNHTTIVMNFGKLLRPLEGDYALPVDFGWHLDNTQCPPRIWPSSVPADGLILRARHGYKPPRRSSSRSTLPLIAKR